jgi:hypothetical protein
MAAKNKFKGRGRTSISREDGDLQDLLGLHFHACRRAEEVEEQIQELHAAGKFPEARVLRMQSMGIQQGLRALEAEVRSVVRPVGPPRTVRAGALASVGSKPIGAPGPNSLGPPTALGSLGADFETAMDPGITLEVTR